LARNQKQNKIVIVVEGFSDSAMHILLNDFLNNVQIDKLNAKEARIMLRSSLDISAVVFSDLEQKMNIDEISNDFLVKYPNSIGGIGINVVDFQCLENGSYLNDSIIDFYLKYLYIERLNKRQQELCHIYSCLFYTKLSTSIDSQGYVSTNILRWTKNVKIFDKDFIIFPINLDRHWLLAIICFPFLLCNEGEESDSESSENYETDKK
jgi:sentrin-specific protease 7